MTILGMCASDLNQIVFPSGVHFLAITMKCAPLEITTMFSSFARSHSSLLEHQLENIRVAVRQFDDLLLVYHWSLEHRGKDGTARSQQILVDQGVTGGPGGCSSR